MRAKRQEHSVYIQDSKLSALPNWFKLVHGPVWQSGMNHTQFFKLLFVTCNSFRKNSAEKGQIFKILSRDPGQRSRTFYSPLLFQSACLLGSSKYAIVELTPTNLGRSLGPPPRKDNVCSHPFPTNQSNELKVIFRLRTSIVNLIKGVSHRESTKVRGLKVS